MAFLAREKHIPLPRNRKELFSEVFRNHWFEIIKLSLVIALFMIPFVTVYMLKAVNVSTLMTSLDESLPVEEVLDQVIQLMRVEMIWMIGIVIGVVLIYLALVMGMSYLKVLIFEPESAKIGQHFFGSFKQSFRDGMVIGIFNGVVIYALKAFSYLMIIYRMDTTGIFGMGLTAISYIILFGLSMYMISLSAFYKMSVPSLFKNSFLLYFARFFKNLGMELLLFGLLIVAMVMGYIFISEIVLVLYMGFFFGLTLTALSIYTQIEFDEYINRINYPHLMNNHIYPNGSSEGGER